MPSAGSAGPAHLLAFYSKPLLLCQRAEGPLEPANGAHGAQLRHACACKQELVSCMQGSRQSRPLLELSIHDLALHRHARQLKPCKLGSRPRNALARAVTLAQGHGQSDMQANRR